MAKEHQRPDVLAEELKMALASEGSASLPIDPGSDAFLACSVRLCSVLINYCSYRIAPALARVDPFDDPFVGAALITRAGSVLGAHRKEGRNEPHAEVETLLGALLEVGSDEAKALAERIRDGLQLKIWLRGATAEKEFVSYFEEMGRLVRKHALTSLGESSIVLLSTLEPCRDFESQPSCSRLIAAFGPDLVVYGCDDTNAKGQGRPVLLQHGISVVPNVAPELNVEINLLFYSAVHYLGQLHSAALASQSRFEVSYVISNLSRLRPTIEFDEHSRLRIVFDDHVRLPVHRAPIELRAPLGDPEYAPASADTDRVLFINSLACDFLALYLQRHFASTGRIPGIIVCPQTLPDAQLGNERNERFLSVLKAAGTRVYTNVLRKTDEQFLALQSILRFEEQIAAEGELYVFAKEDRDRYTNFSGKAHEVTEWLLSLESPRRVSIYFALTAIRSFKAMVSQVKGRGFDSAHPLSRASFQAFVVGDNTPEVSRGASDLGEWLHQMALSHRFTAASRTQESVGLGAAEMLHELISGRLDPIAQDSGWLGGILNSPAWKDRQTAGLFLAGAAKQDPLLYRELIVAKLPSEYDPEHWQELTSRLNAIAKHGPPAEPADHDAVKNGLRELAKGLDEALTYPISLTLLDVVWRFIAASLSVVSVHAELEGLFSGARLRKFIGAEPFLLKELFFYADRAEGEGDTAYRIACDLLEANLSDLGEAGLRDVLIRVTRLSTLWPAANADRVMQRVGPIIRQNEKIAKACTEELGRCRFVLNQRLSGVFSPHPERAHRFATYLFIRTAGSRELEQGLFTAVDREIQQSVSAPKEGRVPVSWRGDRTSLARLALSEVPPEDVLPFLAVMAEDEDASIKWGALVMAMDWKYRRELLGPSPTKAKCLQVRRGIGNALGKLLREGSHYWLRREFLHLFCNEHSPNNPLPLVARLQVNDVIGARQLLRRDCDDEHPEVAHELRRLRRRSRRIALVLPPIERDEKGKTTSRRTTTPPLGLGSIASFLLSHGHDVALFDCHRFPELTDRLPELVRGSHVVGFSVVTSSFHATERLVAELSRALGVDTPKIVLGGHAVTLHPNEFIKDRAFLWDYLVLGDGEHAFQQIVEQLDTQDAKEIDGVVTQSVNAAVRPSASISAPDWDALPWIDHRIYSDPHGNLYEPTPSRNGQCREAHVVMSRGCSWKCSFCTEAILRGAAGEVRRTPSDVLEEINGLVDHALVDRVQFIDDNLLPQIAARNVLAEPSIAWATALLDGLEELARRKPQFGWRGIFRFEDFLRYQELIPNWIRRLRASRCLLLAFGVEHGSEETRRKLKGGTVSNDAIRSVVASLTGEGIATKGYFIVGGAGEDQDSTSQSIDLAVSAGFTLAYFALYKNFRELIRRSRADADSPGVRGRIFMQFKNLLADFDEGIRKINTPEDCLEMFGESFDLQRVNVAHESIDRLSEMGFQFEDLFKYNDFHDNLDEVNDDVSVWRGMQDGGSVTRNFLQAVRRAYFEFYARAEFVDKYRWLIERGY